MRKVCSSPRSVLAMLVAGVLISVAMGCSDKSEKVDLAHSSLKSAVVRSEMSQKSLEVAERQSVGHARFALSKSLSMQFGAPFCEYPQFIRIPVHRAISLVEHSFAGFRNKGPVYRDVMRLLEHDQDTPVLLGEFTTPSPSRYSQNASYAGTRTERILYILAPEGFSGAGLDPSNSAFILDLNQIRDNSHDNPNCHYVKCCDGKDGPGPCCHHCWCISTNCGSGCPNGQKSTCEYDSSCSCDSLHNELCPDLPDDTWFMMRPVRDLSMGSSL